MTQQCSVCGKKHQIKKVIVDGLTSYICNRCNRSIAKTCQWWGRARRLSIFTSKRGKHERQE